MHAVDINGLHSAMQVVQKFFSCFYDFILFYFLHILRVRLLS